MQGDGRVKASVVMVGGRRVAVAAGAASGPDGCSPQGRDQTRHFRCNARCFVDVRESTLRVEKHSPGLLLQAARCSD